MSANTIAGGFLTITLRKRDESIILLDEAGEQVAQIFANLQGSNNHDRIRVSIRADQRYKITRSKGESRVQD
jgi:hypothetical protein